MLRIGQVESTAQNNLYTDGNVASGIAATRLRAAAFNAIQEELAYIIENSGGTLSTSDTTQILTTLKVLFQAKDAGLTSLATLTGGANMLPYYTAADVFAQTSLTAIGRSLIGQSTVADALAYLTGAPLASPTFTGDPKAPTPAAGDNDTSIATTAFVQAANAGLVGAIRNARMNVPTAGATATFMADEVIVADSLSGRQFRLTSFSNTINLATTGANGMDTGTVPAAGYVALYAIYNPTTATSALLAVDATSAVAPEIYAGTHLPSGYTASALVSVWRTSSSLFVIGYQRERHIAILTTVMYSTNTAVTTYSAFSLSVSVPMNARAADMQILCSQTTPNSAIELSIAESPTGIGQFHANASAFSSGSTTTSSSYVSAVLEIIDSQALYYRMSTSTAATYAISCRGYSI